MSSNFQPGEETFDDVSGHKLSRTNLVDEEETEGHKLSRTNLADDEEDAEGHRLSYNKALPDDDEGVEGHKLNSHS